MLQSPVWRGGGGGSESEIQESSTSAGASGCFAKVDKNGWVQRKRKKQWSFGVFLLLSMSVKSWREVRKYQLKVSKKFVEISKTSLLFLLHIYASLGDHPSFPDW